jgi:hypothetical protein
MERETLKSLRAKAKELRSKVSSAPLSKATPEQLRAEIAMLEHAVRADEKLALKKALKEATVVPEKKKTSVAPAKSVKVVQVAPLLPQKMKVSDDREKELLKREKELAKKEKLIDKVTKIDKMTKKKGVEKDSDDY